MSEKAFVERHFFAALVVDSGSKITIDIVRKRPTLPHLFSELADIMAFSIKNLHDDKDVLVFCDSDDPHLLSDLQRLGLQYAGLLYRDESVEDIFILSDDVCRGVVGLPSELAFRTQKSVVRCALKFQSTLFVPANFLWESYFRHAQAHERYILGLGENLSWSKFLAPQKKDRDSATLPIPLHAFETIRSCIARRSSVRAFAGDKVLDGQMLLDILAAGFARQKSGWRPFACAGGLGDYKLLISLRNTKGFQDGFYEFSEERGNLTYIGPCLHEELYKACLMQELTSGAQCWLLCVADCTRIGQKYGARGYRFLFLDTGGLMQQLHLLATAVGLGFRVMGGYDDVLLSMILGLADHEIPCVAAVLGEASNA